jgi:hypothetical protein
MFMLCSDNLLVMPISKFFIRTALRWLFLDLNSYFASVEQNEDPRLSGKSRINGGKGGIRTHGGLAPTPVFKTGAINRSATFPCLLVS